MVDSMNSLTLPIFMDYLNFPGLQRGLNLYLHSAYLKRTCCFGYAAPFPGGGSGPPQLTQTKHHGGLKPDSSDDVLEAPWKHGWCSRKCCQ